MKQLLLFATIFTSIAAVATAQVTSPETGRNYQILNPDGLAFSYVDNGEGGGSAKFSESDTSSSYQSFQFLPTNDGNNSYYIRLVANDEYVTKLSTQSWNTWSITFEASLPTDVSNAKYTLEEVTGTDYVYIKCMNNSKYWGWDTSGVGNGVYTDKSAGEKSMWRLTELDLTSEQLYRNAVSRLNAYIEKVVEYPGLQSGITELEMELEDKVSENPEDDVYMECVERINNYIAELDLALYNLGKIENLFDECDVIVNGDIKYPDFEELANAYQKSHEITSSEESSLEEYLSAYNDLKSSLESYYQSQMPYATEENPADLTYLINNPNFRDTYVISDDTNPTNTGWSTNNTNLPSSGTDIACRTYTDETTGTTRTAFNVWSWQFNSLEVYQDITNLPDGKYQLECEGHTGTEEYYKQHAYATSSSTTVESNYATTVMGTGWETFKTPTILVADGNLRIGFISPKSEEGGSIGWFQITNFKLYYVGAITDADVEETLSQRISYAQSLGLTLKGDIAILESEINNAKAASTLDEKKAVLETLNEAIAVAESAKSVYTNFVNNTLTPIKEEATAMTDEFAQSILNVVVASTDEYIASENSVSDDLDSIATQIEAYKSYISTYNKYVAPYLNEEDVYSAESKSNLLLGLEKEKEILISVVTAAQVEEQINHMIDLAAMMRITKAASDDTDFSFLIVNPDIDASNDNPEGWECSTNGGHNTNAGESYMNDSSDRYLDGYNSEGLTFTASQILESIPNGTYKLIVATRGNGDGAYVYAQTSEETKMSMIVANGNSGGDIYVADEEAEYNAYIEEHGNDDGYAYSGKYSSYGWGFTTIENISVVDHKLTIGVTNETSITGDETGFTGTWFSADKFQLFYIESGDNSDWEYVTLINDVSEESNSDFKVSVINNHIIAPKGSKLYSSTGLEMNAESYVPDGMYIVKNGKNSKKILIR